MIAQGEIERLMDLYGHRLLRMCFLYLRDEQLAEDAVQETFLKVWRKQGSFRGDSQESTWLTSIAINVCRDMLRTGWPKHIDRRIDIMRLPEQTQAFFPDCTVLTEVMRLPARQREVILLRYYQGLSAQETADALHIGLSTVTHRQHKANTKLRERLKEWYFNE